MIDVDVQELLKQNKLSEAIQLIADKVTEMTER